VLAVSNTRRSDIKLSTSSRAIMSPFFSALMAKYSPVVLYWAKRTCTEQKLVKRNKPVGDVACDY